MSRSFKRTPGEENELADLIKAQAKDLRLTRAAEVSAEKVKPIKAKVRDVLDVNDEAPDPEIEDEGIVDEDAPKMVILRKTRR